MACHFLSNAICICQLMAAQPASTERRERDGRGEGGGGARGVAVWGKGMPDRMNADKQ